MTVKNQLQKELDRQKFLHTVAYVRQEYSGIKKLSTTELTRANQFLTGLNHGEEQSDPWRFEPAEIQIPGGARHQINLISNPINRARELIGTALQLVGNNQTVEAAEYLYSQLVLEHLFKAANRRTAVLATLWILLVGGYDCDPELLLSIPIGDLRKPEDLKALYLKIQTIIFKEN
jgi:hypothetical protein